MKDGFGRTIDYLRISLTDRCNLRCLYCMPEHGITLLPHENILSLEEVSRAIECAAELGIKHVRFTGGEPTVRKGLVALVERTANTPGIESVALTTNATLLPHMAKDLKAAGLSRVNISLDTLDARQYREITRKGNLENALAGVQAAMDAGLAPVKLNTVVVRNLNQNLFSFARLTQEAPLHVRFIEYMPVGEDTGIDGTGWTKDDIIPSAELRDIINARAAEEGLPALEKVAKEDAPGGGGPAKYWKFPGAKGTVGFITAMSNHFCNQCNRLRLTADGKIRPCLFSDEEIDVKAACRSEHPEEAIRDALYAALRVKPDAHHNRDHTDRKMSQIGG